MRPDTNAAPVSPVCEPTGSDVEPARRCLASAPEPLTRVRVPPDGLKSLSSTEMACEEPSRTVTSSFWVTGVSSAGGGRWLTTTCPAMPDCLPLVIV